MDFSAEVTLLVQNFKNNVLLLGIILIHFRFYYFNIKVTVLIGVFENHNNKKKKIISVLSR